MERRILVFPIWTVAGRLSQLLALALILSCTSTSLAQLTHQQKVTDFNALVALYDRHYAPYEWKQKAFHFDLLRLQPWLEEVNSSHNDLEFYDICVRYVASFQDAHDTFVIPSYYEAYLPITADIYDGQVLIDFIDRKALPSATYPFGVGDELLAVDGRSVAEWITRLGPYAANGQGNPVSRNRLAVGTILDRLQNWYTYANKVHAGDTATIVVKRQNGQIGTFTLSWEAIGIPLDREGPVPNPGRRGFRGKTAFAESKVKLPMRQLDKVATNEWGLWTGERPQREEPPVPRGLEKIRRHHDFAALQPVHVVAGTIFPFDPFFPAFNPPPGFRLRLGARSTDEFVSGTFPVGNRSVGFIRIPSFFPSNFGNAIKQLQAEIIFMQQNTSGLVIDLMNNGGGDLCYANSVLQFLSPQPFQDLLVQVRATQEWLQDVESLLFFEDSSGGAQTDIDLVNGLIDEIEQALQESRGLTPPIQVYTPVLCNGAGGAIYQPATDAQGNNIAYTRPILLLTNNFTISAAEFFAAVLQDGHRASVYGVRTSGGGGNVVGYDYAAAPFAEGKALVTESLAVRDHPITTPGLPPAPYIENIGIQPDFFADYQTRANLLTGGQPFVLGFKQVIFNLMNVAQP